MVCEHRDHFWPVTLGAYRGVAEDAVSQFIECEEHMEAAQCIRLQKQQN